MPSKTLTVAELFAGVGGFRVGLERTGRFRVVWSNQWEPPGSPRKQFASAVYEHRFPATRASAHVREDIAEVLDRVESGDADLPRFDVLVGGFPCQDYSVAKPLNQAEGILGKKGVLWWEIHRLIRILVERGRPPKHLLLENVDRLLKSPGHQRGRDFAIILRCLADRGYDVEWRVVNAADYGFPQKRRRVFIYATRARARRGGEAGARAFAKELITESGVLAEAFPASPRSDDLFGAEPERVLLHDDAHAVSSTFGSAAGLSPFRNAGAMIGGHVFTLAVDVETSRQRSAAAEPGTLGACLDASSEVPERFFVPDAALPKWRYLKNAKKEPRTNKRTGASYVYTEGALPFPDPLDVPARTILTAEGGSSPSRFRHIIRDHSGRFRRLTPRELERLNGFEADWTRYGREDVVRPDAARGAIFELTDTQRAFCMGNALVVGLVERIGEAVAARHMRRTASKPPSSAGRNV